MKKYSIACLTGLLSLGVAQAAVIGIDFGIDPGNGPGPNMLPGVIGKTTTNVIWNAVGSSDLKVGLQNEDGLGTGATFEFTGTNGTVQFAGTTAVDDPLGFFRTYAFLVAGGTTAATNSFTIGGLSSASADLVFYSTWNWVDAGSEFRVSGDGGASWSDWVLCEGVPSVENAAFSNGTSYIKFEDVQVNVDGMILGEWCTTTNGASAAHRGPFNALQIDATYADAIPPAFSTNAFSMPPATGGQVYEGDLSSSLVSQGTQYVFSNLTSNTWLTVAADGSLSGIPSITDEGENTFSIMVSDGFGNSDTATVSIYVSVIHNRYIDTFDGDGIGVNTGKGGGLEQISPSASYPLTVTDDGTTSTNLAFTQGPASNLGAARSGVATLQKFSVSGGFDLEVVYNIVTVNEPAVLSDSAAFGLVSTNTPTAFDGLFVLNNKSTANSLGISLTERGLQGVTQTDYTNGVSTAVSLNNDQVSAPGTNLVAKLTVEADGSFSYSLDGGTSWSTGTTTFDLTQKYHFAAWVQRHTTGFEIVSVSFVPKGTVNSVGDISMEMISGTEAGFSWYGETGGTYELQVRNNLTVGGEAAWQTVTTLPGYDAEINVTDEVDQSEAFYRVKLVEEE